jgi:hypothetical protein
LNPHFYSILQFNFIVLKHPYTYSPLSLSAIASYGQTLFGMENILASAITKWVAAMPKAYEGVYHFKGIGSRVGFCAMVGGKVATAQIHSCEW